LLYHISYHFYDENAPDESFFDMLDEISGGSVQLGFDGCLLIDVACEPNSPPISPTDLTGISLRRLSGEEAAAKSPKENRNS
jgi:hypothetical protein